MIHGLNNTFLYSAKKLLVNFSNGTDKKSLQGTGFFIKKDNEIILVTNRHVVEPEYGKCDLKGYIVSEFYIESYQSFDSMGYPSKYNKSQILNFNEFTFAKNDLNDVAILKDVRLHYPGMEVNACIDYEMLADKEWFEKKLSVCDSIAYPGFPEWYDKKNNTPIFRMGTIASDPRFDYAYNARERFSQGAARVAYEGFSSGGASGSPVFAVQKGFRVGNGISAPDDFYRDVKLIGINAGHFVTRMEVDFTTENNKNNDKRVRIDDKNIVELDSNTSIVGHSGISYFYKSSVIKDMIDKL